MFRWIKNKITGALRQVKLVLVKIVGGTLGGFAAVGVVVPLIVKPRPASTGPAAPATVTVVPVDTRPRVMWTTPRPGARPNRNGRTGPLPSS